MNEKEFRCPYCASLNSIGLESGNILSESVVDCETCCKPIVVRGRKMGGSIELEVRAENE